MDDPGCIPATTYVPTADPGTVISVDVKEVPTIRKLALALDVFVHDNEAVV